MAGKALYCDYPGCRCVYAPGGDWTNKAAREEGREMALIEVAVPDGISGPWRVETFTVSAEGAAFHNLQSFRGGLVRPGTYKRLMRGHTVVMSNTDMEVRTHMTIIHYARGQTLLNGLGLGVALTAILAKGKVEHVTVVEQSEDVLRLVGPTFESDPRVTLVHADALTYQPPRGVRYAAVWHDIFDSICADNLPTMHRLHRRYGRRCDWQDSWARSLCERANRAGW